MTCTATNILRVFYSDFANFRREIIEAVESLVRKSHKEVLNIIRYIKEMYEITCQESFKGGPLIRRLGSLCCSLPATERIHSSSKCLREIYLPEEKEALDFIQSILRKKLFNDEDFYRFMKDGLIMEELVFTLVPYICIPKTISNQLHNRQAVDSIVRDCRSLVSQKIMAEEYTFRRKDISDPSNIGKAIKMLHKGKRIIEE
ncbi:unnamed protein product [Lepeophtheirus salmonis]|uniref:(salmon louse) hypothetical protein n=1 Tax=Lepeophtheirus salmonis TaxID=72036 RepID=A0A7R8H2N9_LEPSM|nr:unnamed protein product [Lepeophtheirus salmonis]CAF2831266.1 unnamed protein product [Lepeophtheirus salmonis]